MVFDTNEKATQFFVNHSSKVEPTKPLSLIVENKKNQTENTEILDQLQRSRNCGEFAAETKTQIAKIEVLEVLL